MSVSTSYCTKLAYYPHQLSITEISLRTGFNSSSSFTRAFKQYTSYSPTQYRKLFQYR
ncbi:MAG: helix-turn-helix domain-containing protein [Marvinbryantia sp.]